MTDIEFLTEVRRIIKEEVTAYMGAVPSLQEPEEWIGTAALCRELTISKQTLYNWLNHPKTKKLVEPNRQKVGSKVSYNVTAIKAAIKKHPAFFGGGRDYAFRDRVTLTDAQKINRRFKHIAFMVKLGEPVNEADRSWYETEKMDRENQSAADYNNWYEANKDL